MYGPTNCTEQLQEACCVMGSPGKIQKRNVFWFQCINALVHSFILFWMPMKMLEHDMVLQGGHTTDYLFLGNFIYTYVVVTVCLKAGLDTLSWTKFSHLAIWGSIIIWLVFFAIYSFVWPTIPVAPEMTGQVNMILVCPYFWLGFLIVPIVCLILNLIWKSIKNTCNRTLLEEVREMESNRVQELNPTMFKMRVEAKNVQMSLPSQPQKIVFRHESFDQSTPYGYAFSQVEQAVITQEELICSYDTTKSQGCVRA
ncbi:Phospholipid-transporting ATPase IB [Vulpes lagopus]